MMRDDFAPKVVDLLAKRVGFLCSRPGCGQPTSGPQVDAAKSINIGVAAHITAASPNGPRYDSALSPEQRGGIENGIWLCQTCGKLVDSDPTRYPAPLLQAWKQLAEDRAIRDIEDGRRSSRVSVEASLDRLTTELALRNLNNPRSHEFAKTRFSKRLIILDHGDRPTPMPTSVVFFALTPAPLVKDGAVRAFAEWMNPNDRRYEPIRMLKLVPGLWHEEFGKATVWHDGQQTRFIGGTPDYFSYLAADVPTGYVEYGFCPDSLLNPDCTTMYYSQLMAYFVSFASMVRDLAATFGHNGWETSVGMALRGTRRTTLEIPMNRFAARFGRASDPPEEDNLLWCRPATLDTDWTVNEVAAVAAGEILNHWSVSRPFGMPLPEFEGDQYTGAHFGGRV